MEKAAGKQGVQLELLSLWYPLSKMSLLSLQFVLPPTRLVFRKIGTSNLPQINTKRHPGQLNKTSFSLFQSTSRVYICYYLLQAAGQVWNKGTKYPPKKGCFAIFVSDQFLSEHQFAINLKLKLFAPVKSTLVPFTPARPAVTFCLILHWGNWGRSKKRPASVAFWLHNWFL